MKHILVKGGLVSTIVLVCLILIASPVLALTIGNPTSIAFGTGSTPLYRAFYNILETGDKLFIVEGFVDYGGVTQNYTASQAFLFQVLNTSGNTTLLSTPLTSYGDRPIGIYVTAAQATTANITNGTAYGLRIEGNPVIFPSPVGNNVTAYLSAGDWYDESIYGATPAQRGFLDPLRIFIVGTNGIAYNMQVHDGVTTYLTYVQGYNYLTTTGGNLFISGIPNLNNLCPLAFQASVETLTGDAPLAPGTYSANLTVTGQMGSTIGSALTNVGLYLGMSQALAGSMVLLLISIAAGAYLFRRTESGIVVLLLGMLVPFAGVYLGLMPMSLMFVAVIFVVILMGYYFFSRGIL